MWPLNIRVIIVTLYIRQRHTALISVFIVLVPILAARGRIGRQIVPGQVKVWCNSRKKSAVYSYCRLIGGLAPGLPENKIITSIPVVIAAESRQYWQNAWISAH